MNDENLPGEHHDEAGVPPKRAAHRAAHVSTELSRELVQERRTQILQWNK